MAGADGSGHLVVDFQDRVFGAEGAEGFEVFLLHDREGFEDVAHRVAGCWEVRLEGVAGGAVPLVGRAQVEMEEGGVELRSRLEATLFVPHEGRALVSAVFRERLKIPGRVCEFEDAGEEPFNHCCIGGPWATDRERGGGQNGQLANQVVLQARAADFLASAVVKNE